MNSTAHYKDALAFARRGLPVFPLRPGAKEPLGALAPRGAHDASTDDETIRRWWGLSPSANIGVALPCLLVIDRDDRKGGEETLVRVERRYTCLPDTWVTLTAGGEHYWLVLPDGAEIRGGNDKLGSGLDVKTGRGAYVVAPPSRHPCGIRYAWRPDAHPAETPLAIAPDWLVTLLTPPPPPPPRPFRPQTDDDRRVADALLRIPADDREVWLRVGMALRSHFGDAGRALWDAWSATSRKYDPKAQDRTWRSFRRDGVTVATIFRLAKGHGNAA